jgi:hypothetical protein
MYCNFRFELCHGIFWYFLKKNGFWNKTAPFMERSGSTSEIHVQRRTLWSVINCWIRYNDLCCKLCSISDLVNQCIRPSCTLGVTTYPQKKEKKTKPGTLHIKYHLCSIRLSCVVSQNVLGSLGDPHYFLLRMLLSYDKNQVYLVVGSLKYTNAL